MNTNPMLGTSHSTKLASPSKSSARSVRRWFRCSGVSSTSRGGIQPVEAAAHSGTESIPLLSDLAGPSGDACTVIIHDSSSDLRNSSQNADEDSSASLSTNRQVEFGRDEDSLTLSMLSCRKSQYSARSSLSKSRNQVITSLLHALNSVALSDVTLVGRDGVQVRATKYVLACQSPAMQKLLYDDPSRDEVFVGNFGEVPIQAMKHYCGIGSLQDSPLAQIVSLETFVGLVEVASLATIYGFEALFHQANFYLNKQIEAFPSLATAAYDAANSDTPLMEQIIVKLIRDRSPHILLESDSLKLLHIERLQDLLTALMGTDGTRTFQYLHRWILAHGASPKNMRLAREFAANKFCLKSLLRDPSLKDSIQESGFFPVEDIDSLLSSIQRREPELKDRDEVVPTNSLGGIEEEHTKRQQKSERAAKTMFMNQQDAPPTMPILKKDKSRQVNKKKSDDDAGHSCLFASINMSRSSDLQEPDKAGMLNGKVKKKKKSMKSTSKKSQRSSVVQSVVPICDPTGLVYQLSIDGNVVVHSLEIIDSFVC